MHSFDPDYQAKQAALKLYQAQNFTNPADAAKAAETALTGLIENGYFPSPEISPHIRAILDRAMNPLQPV